MKLIDADKLLWWIKGAMNELPDFCETPEDIAKYRILKQIRNLTESGTFEPTPPVQPDTPDPGDKVRHKEHAYKKYGIGVVKEISKSGKQAYVSWPNFDRALCSYAPSPSYYRLDKLEVITDDPST